MPKAGIEAASSTALVIPASALVRDGERSFAWRVKGSVLQKAALVVGDRDLRSGDYVVKAGLADGDRLLAAPDRDAQGWPDRQRDQCRHGRAVRRGSRLVDRSLGRR